MEEDAEAVEPETPQPPQASLPPQQSVTAQPVLLLSPPDESGEDEQEEVLVAVTMKKGMVCDEEKAKVVEAEKVVVFDGNNGMTKLMKG